MRNIIGNEIKRTKQISKLKSYKVYKKKKAYDYGKKAIKQYLPIQPGDVPSTESDTKSLEKWINFKPSTPVELGISKFVEWYKQYYNIN